jgi:hypothetical protein
MLILPSTVLALIKNCYSAFCKMVRRQVFNSLKHKGCLASLRRGPSQQRNSKADSNAGAGRLFSLGRVAWLEMAT